MVYLGQRSLPSVTANQWKAFVHVSTKGVGVEEAGVDNRAGVEEEVVEGGRGHEVVMARVCLVVMGGREEGGGGG